jgi:hypothetical protein
LGNRLQDRLDVSEHGVILEAKNAIAVRFEPLRPGRVPFGGEELMNWPVEFDDQPNGRAEEIDDVGANRLLSTEAEASQPVSAQLFPESFFRAG